MTAIETIVAKESSTNVSVSGRVTFQQKEETVMTKGKTLKKQEALITDNSSSIRLVLWENDIKKVESGSSYRLVNVMVKTYQQKKYITLNKRSHILPSDEVIEREDSVAEIKYENVQCPALAIKSVQCFKSCKKCRTKIIPIPGKQITKCSECGLVELLSKSTNRMLANTLFNNGDEEISLVLFDDKLQQLHKLFCSQQACKKEFQQCDENEIMLMLLTVSATVVFNKNNNSVVAIKEV